jgi:hypothetical protein
MKKLRLKRIGILSVAKWQGLLWSVGGFFMGVLYGYSYSGGRPGVILYYLISSTIIYGLIGFLATAICGLIYNATAGTVSGIQLEFEDEATSRLPPPPQPRPEQWPSS